MPEINLVSIIFDHASTLTGGLVTDVQTALIAAVTLLFILWGFYILSDVLWGIIDTSLSNRAKGRAFSESFGEAKQFRSARDRHEKGSMAYDYYNGLYRKHLGKSRDLF